VISEVLGKNIGKPAAAGLPHQQMGHLPGEWSDNREGDQLSSFLLFDGTIKETATVA
jgi:hypothetical protein